MSSPSEPSPTPPIAAGSATSREPSAGPLSGRVAIVTGGARGVGLGICKCLLRAGAEVVTCGRRKPEQPISVEVAAHSGESEPTIRTADFVEADVRDVEHIARIVEHTATRYGRIDLLVNNAGGAPNADAATASPRFHQSIVTLNLLAPLWFAQRVHAVMSGQPEGGVVVNIGSVSGLRPSPGTASYGAAKAGLLNLTETLAVEWAPKVRVNAISPGPVLTEQSALHFGDGAGLAAVSATIPMGRLATPEDVGNVVVFLASPEARYLTGANLVLHGGGERPAFLTAVEHAAKP